MDFSHSMKMTSAAEEKLFHDLAIMRQKHRQTAFNQWSDFYEGDLSELFELAQQHGSPLSYTEFCRWVFSNTDSPIKQMKKEERKIKCLV